MDAEGDGPMSRVERTFWTFWNYITETVNRFLRPEPPVADANDTDASRGINNHECLRTKDGGVQEVEGEKHCLSASSVMRPVVSWDAGPELQFETGEGAIVEGEIDETGIDVVNLPSAIVGDQEDGSHVKENAKERIPTFENRPGEPARERKESDLNSFTSTGKRQSVDLLDESDGEVFTRDAALVVPPEHARKVDTEPVEKEFSEERVGRRQNDDVDSETEREAVIFKQRKSVSDGMDADGCPVVRSENNEEEKKLDKNMTVDNSECDNETEGEDGAVELCPGIEETKLDSCISEVAGRGGESVEEMSERGKDDPCTPPAFSVSETENMSGQDDAALFQQSYEEDKTVQSDETSPHAVEQSVEDCDVSEERDEDVTSEKRKLLIENENPDNAEEITLDVESEKQKSCSADMTDSDKSDEDVKDVDMDEMKKLHTSLFVDTEVLNILENQCVQNEHKKVTGDGRITQEEEPSDGERKPGSGDRNEESPDEEDKKTGKLDEVIITGEFGMAEGTDGNNATQNIRRTIVNEHVSADYSSAVQTPGSCTAAVFDVIDQSDIKVSSDMGKLCTTVIHEGASTLEEGKAFKNTPLGVREGQELEQLYSYEESRAEVPDHNNESDIGSAAQRFLEEGNCRESQTTLLQEEVESGAAKCLQNSDGREGAEGFEELMETEESGSEKQNTTTPAEKLMKTEADSETSVILHEGGKEEGEYLKEEARKIDFEMGESVCEVESVTDDGAMQEIQALNVAGFTQNKLNDDNFQDFIFSIDDQPTFKTECELETVERIITQAAEEGLSTLEEEAANRKIRDIYCEEAQLEAAVKESLKESNEEDLSVAADHEISTSTLSDESVCQSCPEQWSDVIEDEILDLWIQQTSTESCEVESMPQQRVTCDVSASLPAAESGFFDRALDMGGLYECKEQESTKIEPLTVTDSEVDKSEEDQSEFSITESLLETLCSEVVLRRSSHTTQHSSEEEHYEAGRSIASPVTQCDRTFTMQTEDEPLRASGDNQPDSTNETENTRFMSDTPLEEHQSPLKETPKGDEEPHEVDVSELDFTAQKSRIAVKNPRARPPKDPRSLLHKPSLEPSPSKHPPSRPGVPMGALGIGFKLPGFGGGLPVLKKTKKTVEEETERATEETTHVEEDVTFQPKHTPPRPKWMSPSHPGFGNPLMSELKSKLKKTAKE